MQEYWQGRASYFANDMLVFDQSHDKNKGVKFDLDIRIFHIKTNPCINIDTSLIQLNFQSGVMPTSENASMIISLLPKDA